MLKLGKGIGRAAVRKALTKKQRPQTFSYEGILTAKEIREAIEGIRDAGSPEWSRPLLTWLASHPNTPVDILRELRRATDREVLMSLAMNPSLPADLRKGLLVHVDPEVRDYANHIFSRTKKH